MAVWNRRPGEGIIDTPHGLAARWMLRLRTGYPLTVTPEGPARCHATLPPTTTATPATPAPGARGATPPPAHAQRTSSKPRCCFCLWERLTTEPPNRLPAVVRGTCPGDLFSHPGEKTDLAHRERATATHASAHASRPCGLRRANALFCHHPDAACYFAGILNRCPVCSDGVRLQARNDHLRQPGGAQRAVQSLTWGRAVQPRPFRLMCHRTEEFLTRQIALPPAYYSHAHGCAAVHGRYCV
jgi:hypothetical protein